ncbi:MAG: hypothetical protein Tsb0021_18240 [Chlamydiales bacterium]
MRFFCYFANFLLVFFSQTLSAAENHSNYVISEHASIQVRIPTESLAHDSIEIGTSIETSFTTWDDREHLNAFELMQHLIGVWKTHEIAHQHLIYGQQSSYNNDQKPFVWQVVPFQQSTIIIDRVWRQLQVAMRIAFGGFQLSTKSKQEIVNRYRNWWQNTPLKDSRVENNDHSDPFCNQEVIAKQSVLEGSTVRVLYNYAPIGLGGEKLHFLIIPKKHRSRFENVSRDEYLEAMQLSHRLMQHFFQTRSVYQVYLLHKSGIDAGQTVPHWHMHLIVSTSKSQDFLGKLTVLKKILFGSTPMSDSELSQTVAVFRSEFKELTTPDR